MRKLFLLFGVSGFLFTACVSNPEGEKAVTGDAEAVAESVGTELNVVPSESSVTWYGKKITATHHGTVEIKSGTVTVEGDKVTGGKFVLDMPTLKNLDVEGEFKAKLEGHLKAEDFFDVAQFPEATLEITNADGNGVGTHKVSANLTIKGITKNITFDANVTEITAQAFAAQAYFNIKRADWGITYPGKPDDLISEEINFKVNIVAKK